MLRKLFKESTGIEPMIFRSAICCCTTQLTFQETARNRTRITELKARDVAITSQFQICLERIEPPSPTYKDGILPLKYRHALQYPRLSQEGFEPPPPDRRHCPEGPIPTGNRTPSLGFEILDVTITPWVYCRSNGLNSFY